MRNAEASGNKELASFQSVLLYLIWPALLVTGQHGNDCLRQPPVCASSSRMLLKVLEFVFPVPSFADSRVVVLPARLSKLGLEVMNSF